MEIVLGLLALVIIGVIWHHHVSSGKKAEQSTTLHKVEAPAQESTPVAEPAKEVTSETASKPAKAKKASAAPKKKAAAPKAKAPAKATAKKAAPKKAAPKKAVKTVAKK